MCNHDNNDSTHNSNTEYVSVRCGCATIGQQPKSVVWLCERVAVVRVSFFVLHAAVVDRLHNLITNCLLLLQDQSTYVSTLWVNVYYFNLVIKLFSSLLSFISFVAVGF